MHYTCHRAAANSRALDLAGIDANTPDPPGGIITRAAGNRPQSVLIERGMSRVEALARASLLEHDSGPFLDRMATHYRALVERGITRVVDTAVPLDLFAMFQRSVDRGDIIVPTHLCPTSIGGWLEEPTDVIAAAGEFALQPPLHMGPVKLVFDGAPQCAMCLSWWKSFGVAARATLLSLQLGSLDPIRSSMSVAPRLGLQLRSGISIYDDGAALRTIRSLNDAGLPTATHAIGNDAIRVVLQAYEALGPAMHAHGVARIEHAAFAGMQLVDRIAQAGVAVVAQPDMVRMPAYATVPEIPGHPFFPLRWMHDAGIVVAGSSDYPVTNFDPLDGIRSAVRRRTMNGRVLNPSQCVTTTEAIAMYTRQAAVACGIAHMTGTLAEGKRADFVVVDGDLDDLDTLRVRQTWIGGECVYQVH